MADEGFPLPISSYKELVKVIQGYGRVGTEASLTDVAKITAMNETGISGNNRFLVATGIIKGGKKKAITPVGAELANALEHDIVTEIPVKWRAIVDANDFLRNVVAAVRIRKGMDDSSLESHVAYSAGQPRTPAVATGARTVVDILKNAGVLKDEGGNLVAATAEPRPIPETVEKSLSLSDSLSMADKVQVQLGPGSYARGTPIGGVQLNIDVTIQCTPQDLDDLGRKLRKLLQDFNQPEPERKPMAPTPPAPDANEETAG